MAEPEPLRRLLAGDIDRLLAETDALLWEGIDFASTDSDTTLRKIHLLRAAAELIDIRVVELFGGRRGPTRSPGILEQVIAAAFQTYEGEEIHPDHFEKAAMLWRGITGGHPFEDGNKRTGFLIASYYLERAGLRDPVAWPVEEVIAFGLQISAHTVDDLSAIADRLRTWWRFSTK